MWGPVVEPLFSCSGGSFKTFLSKIPTTKIIKLNRVHSNVFDVGNPK